MTMMEIKALKWLYILRYKNWLAAKQILKPFRYNGAKPIFSCPQCMKYATKTQQNGPTFGKEVKR